LTAIKNLESGKGASLKTLIKRLRALNRADWLSSIAPVVSISPLQMLVAKPRRPRASGRRMKKTAERYKPVHAVEVRLWGQRVGAVALDPGLGFYAFEYDPAYFKGGIDIAPLTMPVSCSIDN
jgi:HipA N-terminal domain